MGDVVYASAGEVCTPVEHWSPLLNGGNGAAYHYLEFEPRPPSPCLVLEHPANRALLRLLCLETMEVAEVLAPHPPPTVVGRAECR